MQQYGQITRAASQYEAAVPAGAAQPLETCHAGAFSFKIVTMQWFSQNDAAGFVIWAVLAAKSHS
jgi:hypothetical protein